MTGFGYSRTKAEDYSINVEIKAVNHRFLDVNIKLHSKYAQLEERIRRLIKQSCHRGRIDVSVFIQKTENLTPQVKINHSLARSYYQALKELGDNMELDFHPGIADLITLPEVFVLEDPEEDMEQLWQLVHLSVEDALTALLLMRRTEGENLAADIIDRNAYIYSITEQLEAKAPEAAQNYYQKLQSRLTELLPQQVIDPQRIIQEAAIFADKINITEEIVRLRSHTQQLDELLNSNEPVGRQGDFLLQEMLREINTIASKSSDIEMSKLVVAGKAELEKIREQIQNVE